MEIPNQENKCSSGDNNKVKAYCKHCKKYICTDCYVTQHLDHESEVVDLAEKATSFLAEYQKLSRAVILISDRKEVHIKRESIGNIVNDLKEKIVKAKDLLQKDVDKSLDGTIKYLPNGPLIQDFISKKTELEGKEDDPLVKLKNELEKVCMNLLQQVLQEHYESADKFLSQELLDKYEGDIKAAEKMTSGDMNYIQELLKLKSSDVLYSFDPMKVLGMIKVNTSVKKPERVIQFNREESMVMMYNIKESKAVCTKFNSGFILPFRFVTIEADSNVYLIGGDNDHNYYLKSVYLYDEIREVLVPLANMSINRSRHSVTKANHLLFVTGGENSEGILKSCEIYDIKNNAWNLLPELNKRRCSHSSCTLNDWVYAGFGWNKQCLNSIERLNLDKQKEWETLRLGKKQYLPELQACGMIPISDNEILVFGGYKSGEELSTECCIVDVKEYLVRKGQEIDEAEAFVSSESINAGGVIYCFGYTKGGLHKFNIKDNKWEFVPEDKIPL